MTQPEPPDAGSLAAKLDKLFATVRPRGRTEYTHEEVAQAIKAAGGPTISGTYVWQLRKGQRDNPTKNHLEALAAFFGVPVSYFFTNDSVVEEQLHLLLALRNSNVRQVAVRAGELSSEGLSALMAMIDVVDGLDSAKNGHLRKQAGGSAVAD